MVGSGASETVANSVIFSGFGAHEISATGIEYSSAQNGGFIIKNAGETQTDVMDGNGTMSYMRVQICDNLNPKKFVAISRINEAGHRVVFDPQRASYIEKRESAVKIWL